MQTEKILSAYAAIAAKFELPEMQAMQLTLTVERFEAHQALYRMIDTFSPTQGWLCFQSAVRYVIANQSPFLAASLDGILLNAELVNAAGNSLHVRQLGQTWATVIYAPTQSTGANEAGENPAAESFLVDRLAFLAADPMQGVVCYQRLWQQREVVGIAPVAARFIGFQPNGNADQHANGVST